MKSVLMRLLVMVLALPMCLLGQGRLMPGGIKWPVAWPPPVPVMVPVRRLRRHDPGRRRSGQ